jgi:hypothetical protein
LLPIHRFARNDESAACCGAGPPARVTTSAYGYAAPGYKEACGLLKA